MSRPSNAQIARLLRDTAAIFLAVEHDIGVERVGGHDHLTFAVARRKLEYIAGQLEIEANP